MKCKKYVWLAIVAMGSVAAAEGLPPVGVATPALKVLDRLVPPPASAPAAPEKDAARAESSAEASDTAPSLTPSPEPLPPSVAPAPSKPSLPMEAQPPAKESKRQGGELPRLTLDLLRSLDARMNRAEQRLDGFDDRLRALEAAVRDGEVQKIRFLFRQGGRWWISERPVTKSQLDRLKYDAPQQAYYE